MDYLQIESSQRQHHEEILYQEKMYIITQCAEMNLFSLLKPKVSVDGNKYCVLYGENIIEGICGYGDTIMKAIYDFNKKFHEPIKIS